MDPILQSHPIPDPIAAGIPVAGQSRSHGVRRNLTDDVCPRFPMGICWSAPGVRVRRW